MPNSITLAGGCQEVHRKNSANSRNNREIVSILGLSKSVYNRSRKTLGTMRIKVHAFIAEMSLTDLAVRDHDKQIRVGERYKRSQSSIGSQWSSMRSKTIHARIAVHMDRKYNTANPNEYGELSDTLPRIERTTSILVKYCMPHQLLMTGKLLRHPDRHQADLRDFQRLRSENNLYENLTIELFTISSLDIALQIVNDHPDNAADCWLQSLKHLIE
ncbi:hypothetical protein Tco_0570929 [Tanacetum coccineum]